MHLILRLGFALALLAACSNGEQRAPATTGGAGSAGSAGASTGSASTMTRCEQVRDHLVTLLADAYAAAPETTFDGLDRADPYIAEGLDPTLTRQSFGPFLTTPAGQAWIERQKQRARTSPEMAGTVEKCATQATPANLDCWLGAKNVTAFQLCPPPG
ncbi:MAG TPA: hypothetical protein VM513_06535 [Kofleriaceae bacterium]|nr:hypothetical protein [Kofleriaceae bacterium]